MSHVCLNNETRFATRGNVDVRKMEHPGTTPVKSLESRWALLTLVKTLENPTPEIAAYIEREEAELGG